MATNYIYMGIMHSQITQTRIFFYLQFCILKILADLVNRSDGFFSFLTLDIYGLHGRMICMYIMVYNIICVYISNKHCRNFISCDMQLCNSTFPSVRPSVRLWVCESVSLLRRNSQKTALFYKNIIRNAKLRKLTS